MTTSLFDPIERAVAAIAAGGIVVVADDEDRENEGDLIMAADAATPEAIAFFVRHTSGVICCWLHNTDVRIADLISWARVRVFSQLRMYNLRRNRTLRSGVSLRDGRCSRRAKPPGRAPAKSLPGRH